MSLEQKLADERRARLAAERLLDQKSRELIEANRKLAVHARALSEEIHETRQEAEQLRGQQSRLASELEVVSNAYAIAERRLWDSLETIRDGFAVYDSENRMVAANKAYLSMFDGLADVTLGARYEDVTRLAAEEGIVDTEGLSPTEWTARMLARWQQDPVPDKAMRLWNGTYLNMVERRTPDGDMVCLHLDMTDMMRMWAAVEAVPDGFVLFDQDDRMVVCNERYREIYSDSAPAMVQGATFEEILKYGLDRGQYAEAIGREQEWLGDRLSHHQKAAYVVEQELQDGRWLRILEKRTPDGGIVGLRVDITEQKRQQAALDEARIAAEGANRAKSAFLANMSHELRTPMNGVVGMADLLCETALSEEQKLYAETIRNSGESLLTLLNDVLDFSKLEAQKLKIVSDAFDLERAVHEVVMLLQATARDKALDLIVDYDMFLPTRYLGDLGRIRQVLTNLIGNAVKFTEAGHVLVRVVGLEADTPGQQQLHITVEDTGIGIAPDMQAHIFGEFNQVDDQQNRKFEGTGLGLAISRQLVQLMGGEMWVESELGQGACFGFRLILPVAEDNEDLPAYSPPRGANVLVVDDREINRTILDRQLSQFGLNAVLCSDGQQALTCIEDTAFSLIITDERMPNMDGHELAAHLRQVGFNGPVLMLSSGAVPEASAAVTMAVAKPLLRRNLIEALQQVLPANTAKGPSDIAPRKMKVLTAEDNRTNQLVFAKLVARLNIDLRFAENGKQAVQAFQDDRPDLIFMDISMPEMDGKQATRAIRQIEGGTAHRVPIVALTAHALAGDQEEILAAGLDQYLTKPLKKQEILAEIARNLPPGCLPLDGAEEEPVQRVAV